MNSGHKITSVVELAKHKVGDLLFRVVFRPVGMARITIPPGSEWMADCHPKILFERGLVTKAWKFKAALPKLCGVDFQYVTELLTSEPVVERFEVIDIARSSDTGEFYYCNADGDWMPQDYLFASAHVAKQEKRRIKGLFATWARREAVDEV